MTEKWAQIPSAPDYDASSLGRLRSWKRGGREGAHLPLILKPRVGFRDSSGKCRFCACLRVGGKYLQRQVSGLVLEAFVGPCPPGMESCHNNGDPGDNRIENLRWDTRLANIADKRRHGTQTFGETHPAARTRQSLVETVIWMLSLGLEHKLIGRVVGKSESYVGKIWRSERWAHIQRPWRIAL